MAETKHRERTLDTLSRTIRDGSPAVALQPVPREQRQRQGARESGVVRVLDVQHLPLTQPQPRRVSVLLSDEDGAQLALCHVGGVLGIRSFDSRNGDGFDEQVIELAKSDVYGKGQRKWFACPGLGGESCGSRRMKLYLPEGEREFACAECHQIAVPHNPSRPMRWRDHALRQSMLRWHEPLEITIARSA